MKSRSAASLDLRQTVHSFHVDSHSSLFTLRTKQILLYHREKISFLTEDTTEKIRFILALKFDQVKEEIEECVLPINTTIYELKSNELKLSPIEESCT